MTIKLSSLRQKPPKYVLASVLCSLGGFLFGIDTGIIGPVTVMAQFTRAFGQQSPTVHGLVVSSILIPAAISSFTAGRVADALGRPMAIAIGSAIFAVGTAIEAAAVHIGMFVAGRVIEGVGEGLYMGTLVVHRGTLTTAPQLLVTCGLMVGFFTCYGSANIASNTSWRLPFILLASYSAAFAVASFWLLPASPRWLAEHGRDRATVAAAWNKLGVLAVDRGETLDMTAIGDAKPKYKVGHGATAMVPLVMPVRKLIICMLTAPFYRCSMYSHQTPDQACFLLFSSWQAGIGSAGDTFLASGVSAIVIFVVTIPATIWADGWGRRRNTIFGGLGMTLAMFVIGGLYAGDAVHPFGAGRWFVIVCIYLFTVTYCISWAVGMKIYAAEIQPQRTRASATSIAHGSNWLTNFLVALVTPTLLANTSYGAYFLFGSCTLVTAMVCWLFMPETRGRTLTEIQDAFGVSSMSRLNNSAKALRRRLQSAQQSELEIAIG
nr:hexose transporter 2 [Quercus suber]